MIITHVTHRQEKRIKIDFPYDLTLAGLIKKIPGTKWSQTMKAWHAPDTQDVRVHLQKLFPDRSVQVNEPEHASPKQVVSTTVRDANIREAHGL